MLVKDRFYIGGEWADPSGWDDGNRDYLDVIGPSTEDVVGRVPVACAEDVDRAVLLARAAFDRGPWPRMTPTERTRVVARLGEVLARRASEASQLMTTEMGAPISRNSGAGSARYVGLCIQAYEKLQLEIFRGGSATSALIEREPVGVVGVIVPWNGPLFLALSHMVPALLAGCSVIVKPAPETPLVGYLLAEAVEEAEFPSGVVSIIPGGRDIGEHLVTHPGVDKIGFTGSSAAGRRVAGLCGERLKRVSLELGGKSAAIVLDDADIDVVVTTMRAGAFNNTGQACNGLTRLLLPPSRYDEVVAAIVEDVGKFKVGDPFDPATELGPLVSDRQRDRVEEYINVGLQEGARAVIGGGRPVGLELGYYVEPTVLVDVENKSRVGQEEIFGPVLAVIRYNGDLDDAVRIANESAFGLHGAVLTQDADLALAVARAVRAGSFSINGYLTNTAAPFGGMKASGIGRQHGPEGFDAVLEYKTINLLDGRVPGNVAVR